MSKWLMVCGLAFLNLVLAAGVYQRLAERSANAQGIGSTRPDIASIAGSIGGQTAVYMLDVSSGRMVTFKLDVANKQMTPVARTNVGDILSRIP